MGIFKKLFGSSAPAREEYLAAMLEMASEGERTYRGMVDLCASDADLGVLPSLGDGRPELSPRGVYKVRLFNALFMVYAFARNTQSKQETEEMLNAATGAAMYSFSEGSDLEFTPAEAKEFVMEFLGASFKAITRAFNVGPWVPGGARSEHMELMEYLHDSLSESFSGCGYTDEVRERLSPRVEANVAMAMNHVMRWVQ